MKQTFERYLTMVEQALEEAVPAPKEESLDRTVWEAMRYSLLVGGKRIRPVLTLAFAELCGGSAQQALPFACAVEMVHTYSLIHDDLPCMDDDDLRRGKPTNHKVFGEAMALLAGDGLLTRAFEQALAFSGPSSDAVRGASVLARCAGASGMVGGQCVDLSAQGKEVDLSLLQQMDQGKTVALISAACQMGCIAAGAGDGQLEAARHYAEGLGMAFQIRDDILDVEGDAKTLGKNVGMDSARDKRNYVSLLGVEEAQRLVESYTDQAISALEAFAGDTAFLRELAVSLATREK
ncbi:MAG TPA: polyprenyl synthetase family protein [Candidatus Acutalibacter pullicola]|uniref:Farnesyl diphosphate synthase n=1 Tax=Candidatus Acutalibacter pullicola TaxID=2838417 RepID=A0A9D2MVX2_9FIRM|nr:polyprenyl synthetase family protein [Candidatus Acutalibacter pullicola]